MQKSINSTNRFKGTHSVVCVVDEVPAGFLVVVFCLFWFVLFCFLLGVEPYGIVWIYQSKTDSEQVMQSQHCLADADCKLSVNERTQMSNKKVAARISVGCTFAQEKNLVNAQKKGDSPFVSKNHTASSGFGNSSSSTVAIWQLNFRCAFVRSCTNTHIHFSCLFFSSRIMVVYSGTTVFLTICLAGLGNKYFPSRFSPLCSFYSLQSKLRNSIELVSFSCGVGPVLHLSRVRWNPSKQLYYIHPISK